jgi:hypothetical protein
VVDIAQVPPSNAEPAEPKSTGSKTYDRKLKKHAEKIAGFKVTDSGITKQEPMLMERGCTDIFWLFIFAGTMLAMLGVTVFGFTQGDFDKMIAPYDQKGNLCGFPNPGKKGIDMTDYPKMYFKILDPTSLPDWFPLEAD